MSNNRRQLKAIQWDDPIFSLGMHACTRKHDEMMVCTKMNKVLCS